MPLMEPTPENITQYVLAGGFCINCQGELGGTLFLCHINKCSIRYDDDREIPGAEERWQMFERWYVWHRSQRETACK
jgi:hypothetical protein